MNSRTFCAALLALHQQGNTGELNVVLPDTLFLSATGTPVVIAVDASSTSRNKSSSWDVCVGAKCSAHAYLMGVYKFALRHDVTEYLAVKYRAGDIPRLLKPNELESLVFQTMRKTTELGAGTSIRNSFSDSFSCIQARVASLGDVLLKCRVRLRDKDDSYKVTTTPVRCADAYRGNCKLCQERETGLCSFCSGALNPAPASDFNPSSVDLVDMRKTSDSCRNLVRSLCIASGVEIISAVVLLSVHPSTQKLYWLGFQVLSTKGPCSETLSGTDAAAQFVKGCIGTWCLHNESTSEDIRSPLAFLSTSPSAYICRAHLEDGRSPSPSFPSPVRHAYYDDGISRSGSPSVESDLKNILTYSSAANQRALMRSQASSHEQRAAGAGQRSRQRKGSRQLPPIPKSVGEPVKVETVQREDSFPLPVRSSQRNGVLLRGSAHRQCALPSLVKAARNADARKYASRVLSEYGVE